MERFFGVLTEQFVGAFPLWLAPVQVRVMTIADRHDPYVEEVAAILKQKGFRVDTHLGGDKLGAKVRTAQLEKIPVMLVCGDKDQAARNVSPRLRDGTQLPAMAIDAFVEYLTKEAAIPRGGAVAS
jgi:threonyl-tRNA synthetase